MIEVNWSNEYLWARSQISIDELGPREDFKDILNFGDLVYLKNNIDFYTLDQIPKRNLLLFLLIQTGEVVAYHGGKNFNSSNFDRVRLSYPQSGSSFKPFIYASV